MSSFATSLRSFASAFGLLESTYLSWCLNLVVKSRNSCGARESKQTLDNECLSISFRIYHAPDAKMSSQWILAVFVWQFFTRAIRDSLPLLRFVLRLVWVWLFSSVDAKFRDERGSSRSSYMLSWQQASLLDETMPPPSKYEKINLRIETKATWEWFRI